MTKFSTGKVHLIKRYFIALAKNFFQSPKFLQIYSKKSDWMTQARAPTGGGLCQTGVFHWGLL